MGNKIYICIDCRIVINGRINNNVNIDLEKILRNININTNVKDLRQMYGKIDKK